MARNNNDWSIFGLSDDPVPGVPADIQNIAQMLTTRETATYEVSVGINGLCTDPGVDGWLGASGDAFRKTLSPLPGLMRQMIDAYNEAAGALVKYAGALTEAQTVADTAYQRRTGMINDWSAKHGGQRPPADGSVPDGLDPLTWNAPQNSITATAVPGRDSAARTCQRALQGADDNLRRVLAALQDSRYDDFTGTYTAGGGDPSAFDRPGAPVQVLGDVLYNAEVDDLQSAMNGGDADLNPDVVRAELDQMTSQYQDDRQFWVQFAPTLGNAVDWIHGHPGTESTDGSDQLLINSLGHRMAAAASNGSLPSGAVSGLSTAGLIGFSKLMATTNGKDYTGDSGQNFLADVSRTFIDNDDSDDSDDRPFEQATDTVLTTTAQNGGAARVLFSGPDGADLVTKLLTDEVNVPVEGVDEGEQPAPSDIQPQTVAALLDAARAPVDPSGGRGTPADTQRIQAAYNVVTAAAAFDHWSPPDDGYTQYGAWKLPPELNDSLEGYAKAYAFDLGTSTADGNTAAGISTAGLPNGQPMFIVSPQQTHDFLDLALKNPNAASDYLGFTKAQYQHAMTATMASNGAQDYTKGYANLVGATQGLVDEQHLSGAQAQDAANAQHAALVNALLGGFGGAPGPAEGIAAPVVGWSQAVAGLATPYIDQLPAFDTGNAAAQSLANHQADQLVGGTVDVSVLQAALDSGSLKVGTGLDDVPPGLVDPGTGLVQSNADFRAWFASHGDLYVTHGDSAHPGTTLDQYVNQMKTAMNDHS